MRLLGAAASAAASAAARAYLRRLSSSFSSSSSPAAPAAAPLVLFSRAAADARVGVLTLNSPASLNALTLALADDLDAAVAAAAAADVRALVVTGAGRAFSAGGDMAFLRARAAAGRAGDDAGNAREMRNFYARFLRPFRETVRVPTIAAINGPAVGAGLAVALALDLRLCARSARLGLAFVNLGLHPGMGSTLFLPQLVGPQLAARLLLTAELVGGDEAARIGLVLEAVEDAELLQRAVALGSRIASNGPLAVRETLRTLRRIPDEGLERALAREAEAQAANYGTAAFEEGLAAIAAKRAPRF